MAPTFLSFLLDPNPSGGGMAAGTRKVNATHVSLFLELLQEALKPSPQKPLEQLWGMSPPSFLVTLAFFLLLLPLGSCHYNRRPAEGPGDERRPLGIQRPLVTGWAFFPGATVNLTSSFASAVSGRTNTASYRKIPEGPLDGSGG